MLIGKRTVQQVAALPFVIVDGKIEIMLITSRERRRLIVPKGWPEKQMSGAAAAHREARDEAGVDGPIAEDPIGFFKYEKQMSGGYSVPCNVAVYPMLVRYQALKWPESKERKVAWYPIEEAARSVDDSDLGKLMVRVANQGASKLMQFADGSEA